MGNGKITVKNKTVTVLTQTSKRSCRQEVLQNLTITGVIETIIIIRIILITEEAMEVVVIMVVVVVTVGDIIMEEVAVVAAVVIITIIIIQIGKVALRIVGGSMEIKMLVPIMGINLGKTPLRLAVFRIIVMGMHFSLGKKTGRRSKRNQKVTIQTVTGSIRPWRLGKLRLNHSNNKNQKRRQIWNNNNIKTFIKIINLIIRVIKPTQ